MFPNLEKITLRGKLNTIKRNTFFGLNHLMDINFMNCNITVIEDGVFDDLVNIKTIDLTNNPIQR